MAILIRFIIVATCLVTAVYAQLRGAPAEQDDAETIKEVAFDPALEVDDADNLGVVEISDFPAEVSANLEGDLDVETALADDDMEGDVDVADENEEVSGFAETSMINEASAENGAGLDDDGLVGGENEITNLDDNELGEYAVAFEDLGDEAAAVSAEEASLVNNEVTGAEDIDVNAEEAAEDMSATQVDFDDSEPIFVDNVAGSTDADLEEEAQLTGFAVPSADPDVDSLNSADASVPEYTIESLKEAANADYNAALEELAPYSNMEGFEVATDDANEELSDENEGIAMENVDIPADFEDVPVPELNLSENAVDLSNELGLDTVLPELETLGTEEVFDEENSAAVGAALDDEQVVTDTAGDEFASITDSDLVSAGPSGLQSFNIDAREEESVGVRPIVDNEPSFLRNKDDDLVVLVAEEAASEASNANDAGSDIPSNVEDGNDLVLVDYPENDDHVHVNGHDHDHEDAEKELEEITPRASAGTRIYPSMVSLLGALATIGFFL